MNEPKKLIEVAMPIKEISAESVRDGRIQHGHISSMHKWWARRPLPVSRAVVFASLVPDPLDSNCPKQFIEATQYALGVENNFGDPYKPYEDIPFTSAIDLMEDNLRNRLLMFIGKFSNEFINNNKIGKTTQSKDSLSNHSLIKWENRNTPIIEKAQLLIYVANNANNDLTFRELLNNFKNELKSIAESEKELYFLHDRHLNGKKEEFETKLKNAISFFQKKMPLVFDPFAGGGAIPLEAARLGCRSFGNDINPVAHIIQKGGLEFPQKYGKPIIFSKEEFQRIYGVLEFNKLDNSQKIFKNGDCTAISVENRLTYDLNFFTKKILKEVNIDYKKILNLESKEELVATYWTRVGTCTNPSCKVKIPLLKQFYLVKTSNKKVSLKPIIGEEGINFEIIEGQNDHTPFFSGSTLKCPICHASTPISKIKEESIKFGLEEKLIAIIENSSKGKFYRLPSIEESKNYGAFNNIEFDWDLLPTESMQSIPDLVSGRGWGIDKWSDMFSNRQLFVLSRITKFISSTETFASLNNEPEYLRAIATYLGIWLDRMASRMTKFGLIDVGRETIVDPFGRQAIPMVFDYPEINPFQMDQVIWINRVIESENHSFYTTLNNCSSGEKKQFQPKEIKAVITDPPYYDAIAYADLSDFFYVWLKRSLGIYYPEVFSSPMTPKSDECTALKHHHNGNMLDAKKHFEQKLLEIFDAIEEQTSDIVSIMFAHQSTEAWTTLCNSILGARMNITGSWANDTELTAALKSDKAFLSSSVTVSCKPALKIGIGEFKSVKKAIENRVEEEVLELYKLGFRGSDLLTACFGQAVSEFGRYEKVEKADGSAVSVNELLEIARESAFNSLLKGFDGDDFTKFYIGWLQLNGLVDTDFDDAAKFTKVGLSIDVQDLFKEHILIKNGNKQHLGSFIERINSNNRLGEGRNNSIIDQTHRLMHLYSSPNRNSLLKYIESNSFEAESPVWRVLTSLTELLPKDIEDHKLAIGLLTNKDQLIREAKSSNTPKPEQSKLIFE